MSNYDQTVGAVKAGMAIAHSSEIVVLERRRISKPYATGTHVPDFRRPTRSQARELRNFVTSYLTHGSATEVEQVLTILRAGQPSYFSDC